MSLNRHLLIACVALALAVVVLAGLAPSEDGGLIAKATAASARGRARFSPSKLFDFSNFKKLFKKNYSGSLEQLVRKKYFLARAFRAYISAIKYKYRKSTFYLAINDMSDWTPKEIRMSRNKVLSRSIREKLKKLGKKARRQRDRDLPEALPEDADETEKTLKSLAEEDSSNTSGQYQVRDLPLERLINTGSETPIRPEVAAKLKKRVPSNNPDHEPLDLASFGLVDEQVDFTLYEIHPSDEVLQWCSAAFTDAVEQTSRRSRRSRRTPSPSRLPDQVFADLRTSYCFTPVRHQGTCGACYAFASMAVFEWMYCKQTNNIPSFSEQYVIDCGTAYVNGLHGCDGGQQLATGRFVKNFGLEMLADYPYFMRQNYCPYQANSDLDRTGYIRFEFSDVSEIPMSAWPYYLSDSPIVIAMAWEPMFHEYGNGVFGWGCTQVASSHAAVVVGHGREDGHQYWLIRNSHGPNWGQEGYGKLAKAANCIVPAVGYVFASSNGFIAENSISYNQWHNPYVVSSFIDSIQNW